MKELERSGTILYLLEGVKVTTNMSIMIEFLG
jgi:hypothetical protein